MTSSAPSMQSREAERLVDEVDLAGLDLREVEDVVDDRQQRVARRADRVGVVALLGVELRLGEQAAHADDRVHRRADLVAHRGQERALGLVRCRPRPRVASRRLGEQPGVVDGDRGLLRQADEEVEIGRRERTVPRPVRQTAIMPLTPSRPISGATISRSTLVSSAVPGDRERRACRASTSLTISGRASAASVPMMPSPRTTVVGLELLGDVARRPRWRGSLPVRRRAGTRARRRRRAGRAPAPRCAAAARRGRASPRSRGRRRPASPSRARGAGTRGRAGRSGSRCRCWRRSWTAAGRRPRRSGRPRSMLWTLTAPIASSPTMIGTPEVGP